MRFDHTNISRTFAMKMMRVLGWAPTASEAAQDFKNCDTNVIAQRIAKM
jgi:hypothetical protein